MEYTIEKIRPHEAEELLEYLKCVGGESDNLSFGPEGLPFSVEAEREYLALRENSPDGIVLGAKHNGRIVASASLDRLPRRMAHRGELGLTVLKEHWGRGLGSRLTAELIAFAKENGYDILELQVRSDNHASIRIAEKFGFTKLCSHSGFVKINGRHISCDYMTLYL